MPVVLAFTAPGASARARHRRHRHGRTFWQKHRERWPEPRRLARASAAWLAERKAR